MPLLIAHISLRLYYTYTSKDRSQLSRDKIAFLFLHVREWDDIFLFIGHADIQTKACLLNIKLLDI